MSFRSVLRKSSLRQYICDRCVMQRVMREGLSVCDNMCSLTSSALKPPEPAAATSTLLDTRFKRKTTQATPPPPPTQTNLVRRFRDQFLKLDSHRCLAHEQKVCVWLALLRRRKLPVARYVCVRACACVHVCVCAGVRNLCPHELFEVNSRLHSVPNRTSPPPRALILIAPQRSGCASQPRGPRGRPAG